MTLTQLTYAVAVDTHRHFGRAAKHCHISQPTLSTQIQKLEGELGIQLFDRSRQPVLPTDLGKRVLAQARVVLREQRRIHDLIAEAAGEVAGTLRLAVLPTLAPYLLPLVTRRFSMCHPGVTVALREMTTASILEYLATDQLDAGLIATEEKQTGLTFQPLFTEPFVAYVAPDHRLASTDMIDPHALRTEDMWLLSEGHCFRDQVLHLCGQADEVDNSARPVRFESGSLETLRMMVARAGGLTLLPYLATLSMSKAERARVHPLTKPVPQRTVRLACGRAYLRRPQIEAYVNAIREAVAPHERITLC